MMLSPATRILLPANVNSGVVFSRFCIVIDIESLIVTFPYFFLALKTSRYQFQMSFNINIISSLKHGHNLVSGISVRPVCCSLIVQKVSLCCTIYIFGSVLFIYFIVFPFVEDAS